MNVIDQIKRMLTRIFAAPKLVAIVLKPTSAAAVPMAAAPKCERELMKREGLT